MLLLLGKIEHTQFNLNFIWMKLGSFRLVKIYIKYCIRYSVKKTGVWFTLKLNFFRFIYLRSRESEREREEGRESSHSLICSLIEQNSWGYSRTQLGAGSWFLITQVRGWDSTWIITGCLPEWTVAGSCSQGRSRHSNTGYSTQPASATRPLTLLSI